MRFLRSSGFFLAILVAWGGCLRAAPADVSPEEQKFAEAFSLFQHDHFSFAESNFTAFVTTFTNSPHLANAILYIGRSRLGQSNYAGAIEILEKSAPTAGALAPDYQFWMAKARSALGNYARAADGFGAVAKDFPQSPLRLEAAYDQAEDRSRLNDWAGVIRLLQDPAGAFHAAAAADAKSDFATLGALLLGEALFKKQQFAEAEKIVANVAATGLATDVAWQRQYLLCRVELEQGRAQEALNNSTNLLALAFGPRHQAISVSLQGAILEKLGRPGDALQVYAKNIVDNQPAEVQRQALARTVELTVALNTPSQAIQALGVFIAQHPQTPGLDLAEAALGGLYLKAYATPAALESGATSNLPAGPDTNLLTAALTNLNNVINGFTNSEALPRARLDRGWCYCLQGNIGPSAADFQFAADKLPFSEDQAVARFKLADAQYFQRNYPAAASNYSAVITRYASLPSVTNSLVDLALYQLAEADIQRGDDAGASEAVKRILEWFPTSYYGDRGQLLLGEDLNRKFNYAQARDVFTNLLQRAPRSTLAPQVEYAVTRTYDQQGQWNAAITGYQQWITNHPGDTNLPEVEFHLALARGKAGLASEALEDFTNFVSRFPSNALAPQALNWTADYYYNQGDYRTAEKTYEQLFQNYPGAGELYYQAQFWAGKAALARQGIDDARVYFAHLVSDTNTPPALLGQTYMALGDVIYKQYQANPTKDLLNQAIAAVSTQTNGAPTNALAVEALGRLGDYYWDWAVRDTNNSNSLVTAKQAYQTIAGFPPASVGVSARDQAEVGLGLIAEQQHRLREALGHYYKVLHFGSTFDPYWVQRAGEYAARICEDQQSWDEAVQVYRRVLEIAPSLAPALEKKIAADQSRKEAARN